jgi:hypothetical protein
MEFEKNCHGILGVNFLNLKRIFRLYTTYAIYQVSGMGLTRENKDIFIGS